MIVWVEWDKDGRMIRRIVAPAPSQEPAQSAPAVKRGVAAGQATLL